MNNPRFQPVKPSRSARSTPAAPPIAPPIRIPIGLIAVPSSSVKFIGLLAQYTNKLQRNTPELSSISKSELTNLPRLAL